MEEGIVRDDILGSRNLGSGDYWVGVRAGGASFRAFKQWVERNGRRPAHRPNTEGAGTRVWGYAIKNSGLTVV